MHVTVWLGWLFSVIGLAIIIQQQVLKLKARASQSWPTVEGAILKSEILHKHGHNSGSTYRQTLFMNTK